MIRLALRRLATAPLLVLLVLTLTFAVLQAVPGSVADLVVNPRLGPQARDIIRERYGLDLPPTEQYLRWLSSAVRGDLGVSFLYRQPVRVVLLRALPPTLLLTGSALLIDLVLGILLAVAAVRRPHGWFDRASTVLSLGLYGIPSFWLAGLLILVFSVLLGWFPSSHLHTVAAGQLSTGARLLDLLHHLVLPAACLGLVGAAGTARYLRAAVLDVRSSRYILAAHARGIPERRVLWLHTLRPALLPVVTVLGLSLPFLVSGSVVIEVIFSWPGMGQVLWRAAWARDIPVILAATLLATGAVVLGNLLADLLYMTVDPRARSER